MAKYLKFVIVSLAILFSADLFAATSLLKVNWASTLKSGRIASAKKLNFATPLIVGDTVFIGNSGGYFYAVGLAHGKKKWGIKLQGAISGQPAVYDGQLFVGDEKGYVYQIDPASGEIKWQAFVGEEIMATPAVEGKHLYIATQNNSLFALDRESGTNIWTASRPQAFSLMTIKGYSNPVIIDGNIYVGNTDGVLVVYDAANGTKLRTIPLATGRGVFTDIDTSPLKVDNRLYVSSMEGTLYSIDIKTENDIWKKSIGTPNNIVYREGRIFVTTEGRVYCLNADNGEEVWVSDLKVQGLSQVVFFEDSIAVMSTDEKIYLLDKATGNMTFERYLGGGSYGAPVATDDKLLVLTNSGNLYSFRMRN